MFLSFFLHDAEITDERFPNDHKITLIFINTAQTNDINRHLVFQNPLVRVEPLSNCSSLDNISEGKLKTIIAVKFYYKCLIVGNGQDYNKICLVQF